MTKIIFFAALLIGVLYVLKKNSSSNIYGKLIIAVFILVFLFIIATSGKFILPQLLQILKIGLPFITKFIGI